MIDKRINSLKNIGFIQEEDTNDLVLDNHRYTAKVIESFGAFEWAHLLKSLKHEISEKLTAEIKVAEMKKGIYPVEKPVNNRPEIVHPCRITEDNEIYHSPNGYISSTTLKEYRRSPLHARHAMLVKREPTPAIIFGSAYHTLILEPELFDKEYYVLDLDSRPDVDMNMNSKNNKRWREDILARNVGRQMITKEQHDIMLEMKEVLMANRNAVFFFTGGIAEESYYFEIDGVKCKIKPDYRKKKAIADLKTTEDSSPKAFSSSCAEYGYHISAAMYRIGVSLVDGLEGHLPFYFVVQEKKPPYAVAVYLATDEFIRKGEEEFYQLLNLHKSCVESGNWPAYEIQSDNERGILTVDLPNWYTR